MKERYFVLGSMAWIMISTSTASAECRPIDFLLPDTKEYHYSNYVNLAMAQSIDEASASKKSRSFMGSLVVDSIPIGMDYKDAQAAATYKAKKLNIDFTQQTRLDVLTIGVSSVGAAAYESCLESEAEFVRIKTKEEALSAPTFPIQVKYAPNVEVNGEHTLTLIITGGEFINHGNQYSAPVAPQQEVPLIVKRDLDQDLNITALVEGVGGGTKTLYLPPRAKVQLVAKNLKSETVSIVRSFNRGDDYTEITKCVYPSEGAMLLPSTITFEGQLGGPDPSRAKFAPSAENSVEKACAKFSASGAGGKYETYITGMFTVYEVVAEPIVR